MTKQENDCKIYFSKRTEPFKSKPGWNASLENIQILVPIRNPRLLVLHFHYSIKLVICLILYNRNFLYNCKIFAMCYITALLSSPSVYRPIFKCFILAIHHFSDKNKLQKKILFITLGLHDPLTRIPHAHTDIFNKFSAINF